MFGSTFFAGAPFGSVQGQDAGGGASLTGGAIETIVMDQGLEMTVSNNVVMI